MKVYFDNAATTMPTNRVSRVLGEHVDRLWYNPSALYAQAIAVENEYNKAKQEVCSALGAKHAIFTSGGTESINTAILRGYRAKGAKKLHFITSAYEHPAGDEPFKFLASQGHDVDFVKPAASGHIAEQDVSSLVRGDTAMVSIMHVNNETGGVNDVVGIAAAVKRKNPHTLFHSDGVQAFLKCPLNFENSQLDYYSVSAHKVHGLKGTGALIYKKNAPLGAYILGGGQEETLRSGTQNTPGALVFAEAVREFVRDREENIGKISQVRETLCDGVKSFEGVHVLSPEKDYAPHILYLSFENTRGEVILHLLEKQGVLVSIGSACSSKKGTSRIASALSLPKHVADGVLRLSFCHHNTVQEAEYTLEQLKIALDYTKKFVRR